MKILVCVKQVPAQEARPVVNAQRTWAEYEGKTAYWINRYDEHAVEEALRIKEKLPGTMVDIVSIGPPRVTSAIRRCLEMGADRGFHFYYDSSEYASPSLKSHLIAEFCRSMDYDLILTGVMSEDMMSAQTGPMIAARLGIPSATSVISLKVDTAEGCIRVERELEAGHRCSLDLTLPALVTVQSGINRPRYPSLSNVLRAKNTEIEEIRCDTSAAAGKYETVARIQEAQSERAGLRLEGTTTEKAAVLWQLLHEKSLI